MSSGKRIHAGEAKDQLPLSTLLSQVLVAFTIEFDNEFEHRSPHQTTMGTGTGFRPWLTSMAMYSNLLRLVTDEGVTVRELERQARTPMLQLNGMQRWGYIVMAPDPADKRAKPPERDWLVRPKAKGRMAKDVWAGLFAEIEERWQARFGAEATDRLRAALVAVVNGIDRELPEYLPVLGYGLTSHVTEDSQRGQAQPGAETGFTLPALLSKALLEFTLEFERESSVSLAICANMLRVLGDGALRVRDLPRLSGVSKEAIAMATGFLKTHGYLVEESDPEAKRGKLVRLTAKGQAARDEYLRLLGEIEQRWEARFGAQAVENLRESLAALAGHPLLWAGLEPYPDGWRAKVPKPETLPHFPMVLHRGGYPDGS
jgi:DNA-binding MarR family transcriptional regulator